MIKVLKDSFTLVEKYPSGTKTGMITIEVDGVQHELKSILMPTKEIFINASKLGLGTLERRM